jgi:hypothetical protein
MAFTYGHHGKINARGPSTRMQGNIRFLINTAHTGKVMLLPTERLKVFLANAALPMNLWGGKVIMP